MADKEELVVFLGKPPAVDGGLSAKLEPTPPAKAAPPKPNFAAIAKALRRLTAMLISSAISAWSCVSLSTSNLPFFVLGYERQLPRANRATSSQGRHMTQA
jgi:hypothetical protein